MNLFHLFFALGFLGVRFVFCFFETGSHCGPWLAPVDLTGHKLIEISLPLPPESWD